MLSTVPVVRAPLFSLDACGQLGGEIYYSRSGGQHVVRALTPPANPSTPAQETQRQYYRDGIALWNAADWTALDLASWPIPGGPCARVSSVLAGFLETYLPAARGGDFYSVADGLNASTITPGAADVRLWRAGHTTSTFWLVHRRVPNGELLHTATTFTNPTQLVFNIADPEPGNRYRCYIAQRLGSSVGGRRTGFFTLYSH